MFEGKQKDHCVLSSVVLFSRFQHQIPSAAYPYHQQVSSNYHWSLERLEPATGVKLNFR